MKHAAPKPQRCAIYTRKSTDHNLDLAFNSLDAQREACEAYVKSQAHEGWKLIPDRYDDGAFSGASLERPALQNLLDEVRLRKIDIIVVYKVDRLTRSLADFAKLVELFDEHEVSFVSVTQSFNTTSSMGRLTLNVLLSFAQFEREVIGERVRDKISASKRKGIWVGGPVPLGYRVVDKKVEIVPEEADLVRKIFETYLQLGAIRALSMALERDGHTPKPRQLRDGRVITAGRFMPGALGYLLKNRFYIGEIAYKGEIYPGEHQPVLPRELFDAVQARLAQGTVERKLRLKESPALLLGRIFDDRGNVMSPSHANKKGVRYRYYVSRALVEGRLKEAGAVKRISAPDVERIVCDGVRSHCKLDPDVTDRDLVEDFVVKIIVRSATIDVELQSPAGEESGDQPRLLTLPFRPFQLPRKGVAHEPKVGHALSPEGRQALLQAIARSRRWIRAIVSSPEASLDDIAASESLAERHVRFLLPLAFLSPRIISAIADGTAPADLTVTSLARALPHRWSEQEAIIISRV